MGDTSQENGQARLANGVSTGATRDAATESHASASANVTNTRAHRHRANQGSHRALASRDYKHGTRARYVNGCRCFECKRANSAYYHARKADPRVDAAPVLAHIRTLQAQGVGLRAISDVTDIPRVALKRIVLGQPKIRQSVAQKVLDCTPEIIADGAFVDATETRALLQELLREGYTRARLLSLLNGQTLDFQYRAGHVFARTALRIKKLHAALLAESSEPIAPPEHVSRERGAARPRILRALALFSEVGAQELFDALDLVPLSTERATYMQMLHRLWKSGLVERIGDHVPYTYRLVHKEAA